MGRRAPLYATHLRRSFLVYKFVTKYSLTLSHKCDIIIMSRGELKCRKQETVDRQKRNLSRIVRTNSLGVGTETSRVSER